MTIRYVDGSAALLHITVVSEFTMRLNVGDWVRLPGFKQLLKVQFVTFDIADNALTYNIA